MPFPTRSLLACAVLLLTASCGGEKPIPRKSPFAIDANAWVILENSGTGVADAAMPVGRSGMFLPGPTSTGTPSTADAVAFTRSFLLENAAIFGVNDPSQLTYDGETLDDLNLRTFSFHQAIRGVAVGEAAISVTYDENGELLTVDGGFEPGATDVRQTISVAQAVERSRRERPEVPSEARTGTCLPFFPTSDLSRVGRRIVLAPPPYDPFEILPRIGVPEAWELQFEIPGSDEVQNPCIAFVNGEGEFRGTAKDWL